MENRTEGNQDQLLESTYNEALVQNEINESHWKNFKEEHEALSSRLLSLRDKLKHDIMVPVGKLALMKGKLVHTNEILVSLGDGWFAKQSASEAFEICKRRVKACDEMLDKINKERDLLTSRKMFPIEHDLFSNDEIIEPYDEAFEAEWKVKHRERIRAYKKEEAKKRQENKVKDEKDLFDLLDALELQEEEEEELHRLGLEAKSDNEGNANDDEDDGVDEDDDDDDDGVDEDDDDDDSESDNSNVDEPEEQNSQREIAATTNYGEDNFNKIYSLKDCKTTENVVNSCRINESDDTFSHMKRSCLKNSQKVSFHDESFNDNVNEVDPVIIHFRHSDVLPKSNSDSHVGESKENINSPSDIYKGISHSSNMPKSILKKSVSIPGKIEECSGDERLDENENLNDVRRKRSGANPQVKIGDITERFQNPSSHVTSGRTVSRFKAARQAAKQ